MSKRTSEMAKMLGNLSKTSLPMPFLVLPPFLMAKSTFVSTITSPFFIFLSNSPYTHPNLANLLPPPDDFSLPIVKLLTHPTYQAYQSHTAALSLYANVFVKFLPPVWGTPTPPTPAPTQSITPSSAGAVTPGGSATPSRDTKEKKEWKRRIKMYSAYYSPHI